VVSDCSLDRNRSSGRASIPIKQPVNIGSGVRLRTSNSSERVKNWSLLVECNDVVYHWKNFLKINQSDAGYRIEGVSSLGNNLVWVYKSEALL